MQRFAKPCTSVQFRSGPPFYFSVAINPSVNLSDSTCQKYPCHRDVGCGIPGIALSGTAIGFGAIAREAGFDFFWMTFFTSLNLGDAGTSGHGQPICLAVASIFLMFVAAALANLRMMLMSNFRVRYSAPEQTGYHYGNGLFYIQFAGDNQLGAHLYLSGKSI